MNIHMKIFRSQSFDPLRVVMLDDEPWYIVTDICRTLGYGNATKAVRLVRQEDKTIINGGNITTGQIHNKARTTTYDLDNAWIRMGKDAGTRVDIDTGRIRWYWENNLTGVLSSRYGKSYIGDNSRYTFLGWFSTGDPSFDYSTSGATSEFVGIAIDQVDKVIHCNASKFEIPGRIECGSLSVNGREI